MESVLFISYDGMTDPLGQSQVLPYLAGLSQLGYRITLLSCEKPDRLARHRATIDEIVQTHGIDWQPITFTSRPPIIAKYYDLYRLQRKAEKLYRQKKFSLVHCRSYVSAAVGLKLKNKYGLKFLFDMRGFWVDERVDGGSWNLKNPLFRFAYKSYKRKEAAYMASADAIISLTEAGKKEIESWPVYQHTPIQVIPCSADFDLFKRITPECKARSREQLGISAGSLVISYLGSVGMWYMLGEMLELFTCIKKKYPMAVFLFITPEPAEAILKPARTLGLQEKDFVIRFASRKEVPGIAAASDINLFFIKPSYSKIASSPTKLGEVLAMGLPVICNNRVGDVEGIVQTMDAGLTIEKFNAETYNQVVNGIPALLKKDAAQIRQNAAAYYTLDQAIQKYAQVYDRLLS